jgi:hypothetical protein
LGEENHLHGSVGQELRSAVRVLPSFPAGASEHATGERDSSGVMIEIDRLFQVSHTKLMSKSAGLLAQELHREVVHSVHATKIRRFLIVDGC